MSDKMHTQERATYWERRWHNGPFHIVAMEVAKIENALKKSEKAFSNLQDDHLQLHQNCAALKRGAKFVAARLRHEADYIEATPLDTKGKRKVTIARLRELADALLGASDE